MKTLSAIVLAASTLTAGLLPAAHAQETASESRTVDARVTRVRIDGVINVRLKQGATPSLTIFADRQLLPQIAADQNGDTLVISSRIDRRKGERWERNGKEVRAELTLPNLRELSSRGVGSSDAIGFTGEDLEIALDGSGSINIASQFKRVNARLAGVGSINLAAGDADKLEIQLPGAGHITATGKAKELDANVSGVGNLDARQLTVDTLRLGLHGVGGAVVTVKQTANVDLNGIGSATIYGQPANRNVTMNGLGKAVWK